jgi:putative hemolysin
MVPIVALGVALSACRPDTGPEAPVAIANPASENCIALGGTLEIVDEPGGQVGWCTLPDGRRVEEWALWRETNMPGTPTDGTDLAAALVALDAAEARWQASGIRSYTMVQRPVCFCPEIVHTVTVEDERIVAVETVTDMEPAMVGASTVTEVFARIRRAIEEGAAEVRVTYDPVTGVPLEVWVDIDRLMADEEWGVTITAFTPAS